MKEGEGSSEEQAILARQARHDEFARLLDNQSMLRTLIETGLNTTPSHLDAFLAASVAFAQFRTHHPMEHHSPNQRETDAERFLRYQKILRGSYQREKATYCMEEAQYYRETSNEEESLLQQPQDAQERDERVEIIQKARFYEANWLRTAANCLTMPMERPPTTGKPEETY
jgi:hypothetical protein